MSTDGFTRSENEAYRLGRDDGIGAASWLIDGNTDDPVRILRRLAQGIDDGDPEIINALPRADLSGEWAGGWTPASLVEWCEHGRPGVWDDTEDLCDAYALGFDHGVEVEVRRMLTVYGDDDE